MATLPGFTATSSFGRRHYRERGQAGDPPSNQVIPQRFRVPFSTALVCSGIRSQCEGACMLDFVYGLDTGNPGPAVDGYHDCMGQCSINSMTCNAYGKFYL